MGLFGDRILDGDRIPKILSCGHNIGKASDLVLMIGVDDRSWRKST